MNFGENPTQEYKPPFELPTEGSIITSLRRDATAKDYIDQLASAENWQELYRFVIYVSAECSNTQLQTTSDQQFLLMDGFQMIGVQAGNFIWITTDDIQDA